ncbi:MAG: hypothetical protein RL595_1924 [Planctomycetota bacterium]
MWLWAKYVVGFNEKYHCTNCLRGRYSNRFSKARNPQLAEQQEITFDEHSGHDAIYICGVARKGYSVKKNYEHNVHLAIKPTPVSTSRFQFENWTVEVQNGVVLPISGPEALRPGLKDLPHAYTTCRIFRWAAGFYPANEQRT